MDDRHRLLTLAAVVSAALVLTACDQQGHPDESAGRRIDHAAENASRELERAGSEIGAKTKEATSKAATAVDDAAVTAKVKAALYAEPGLKTLQIDVETREGVVTLAGSVESAVLRTRAVQIAGSLMGVRSVVDKLVVKAA